MWPHRLAVRTSDSHSDDTGSIPVGAANKKRPSGSLLFQMEKYIGIFFLLLIILSFVCVGHNTIKAISRNFFNKKHLVDSVFVLIFAIILIIPMLRISDAKKSTRENRMLATFPQLIIDGEINQKYGTQFDAWFNDRFNCRKQMIRFYTHVKKFLSYQDDKVLRGKDGWLFYKGDKSLDNFQNKNLFLDDDLQRVAKYLADIDQWANKNGKNFYYVIAPDKNKIYGEYITTLKKVNPDTASRANQLISYLNENTNVKSIYLYDVLTENKDRDLLYYKHDTHWNHFGAYIGYREIVNHIAKQYPSIKPLTCSDGIKVSGANDLVKMMDGSVAPDTTTYFSPKVSDNSVCEYNSPDKNDMKGFTCTNKTKKLKAMVLRDSFTSNLVRYFNNTFNTVKYKWSYDLTEQDLQNIKENYDIIILEQVERFVPNLLHMNFPATE